jgi:aromatic amino acid aminotransferase I
MLVFNANNILRKNIKSIIIPLRSMSNKIVKPVQYNNVGSDIYNKLKIGPMKRLYKYYTPGAINLAGGVPMERIFPFEGITFHLSKKISLPSSPTTSSLSSSSSNDSVEINNYNIEKGSTLSLNYLRGDGMPTLRDWILNHVKELHSPLISYNTCMTVGSTDAMAKILQMFNGDSVLFDEYAYGAAVNQCEVFGKKPIGVKMDNEGMIPEDLRNITLDARSKGLNPDLVYLVPVAQNPTGRTMSLERKKEIYKVCQELDLIIIEDGKFF